MSRCVILTSFMITDKTVHHCWVLLVGEGSRWGKEEEEREHKEERDGARRESE